MARLGSNYGQIRVPDGPLWPPDGPMLVHYGLQMALCWPCHLWLQSGHATSGYSLAMPQSGFRLAMPPLGLRLAMPPLGLRLAVAMTALRLAVAMTALRLAVSYGSTNRCFSTLSVKRGNPAHATLAGCSGVQGGRARGVPGQVQGPRWP